MNGQRVKIMSNKVKVGSKIKLFYDGKLGRMTIGEIVEKKRLDKIKVRFIPWASDEGAEPVEGWLKRKKIRGNPTYYTGYVKHNDSLMDKMWHCSGDYYVTHCETASEDDEEINDTPNPTVYVFKELKSML